MDQAGIRKFIDDALGLLQGRLDMAAERFGIDKFQDYDYDIPSSRFWWSNDGVPMVEAEMIVVGSVSTATRTWLWSWGNRQLDAFRSPELEQVREFGDRHKIGTLTEAKWDGDEKDGWAMTAICGSILGCEAAYRCPVPNGYLFVLLRNLKEIARD